MSWTKIFRNATRVVHVVPINDIRDHQEKSDCWCKPKLEHQDEGTVVIHNSADGRELWDDK